MSTKLLLTTILLSVFSTFFVGCMSDKETTQSSATKKKSSSGATPPVPDATPPVPDETSYTYIEPLLTPKIFLGIGAGREYTCAIKTTGTQTSGTVKCWGREQALRLGNNTLNKNETAPFTVPSVGSAKSVRLGFAHVCARLDNNSLKCWGRNDNGQSGDGTTNTIKGTPGAVSLGKTIQSFKTGGHHNCAILTDGTLWCWGANQEGQLGVAGTATCPDPSSPSDTGACVPTPVQVSLGGKQVSHVKLGLFHTCSMLKDETLHCWGDNRYGQVGVGGTTDQGTPQSINFGGEKTKGMALGLNHSCAVLANGTVQCWGDNQYGQLGIGGASPLTVDLTKKVKSVQSGDGHSCAILEDKSLWCWGKNDFGQVGVGTSRAFYDLPQNVSTLGVKAVSVTVGQGRTCAILNDDTLWCWGKNGVGQVGVGNTTNVTTPTQVTLGGNVDSVKLGGLHTCALLQDDSLKCWGDNDEGQVGMGDTTDYNTPQSISFSGGSVGTVSLGDKHSCVLLIDDTVWCWGKNDEGQVGDSNLGTDRTSPVQVTFSRACSWCVPTELRSGDNHSCAIMYDNLNPNRAKQIYCWGRNDEGQLGNNLDLTDRDGPRNVSGFYSSELAEVLEVGPSNGCVILGDSDITDSGDSTGILTCWGKNDFGQTGTDQTITGLNEAKIVFLGTGRSATSVKIGRNNICALLDDNSLKCWGKNNFGQVGIGDLDNHRTAQSVDFSGQNVKNMAVGSSHSCAGLTNGTLKCWGDRQEGRLGIGGTSPQEVASIQSPRLLKSGMEHSCAVLQDKTLWCWGNNSFGRIGVVTGEDTTVPQQVSLSKVKTMAVGMYNTCAILTDGTLECWGRNHRGQVGAGDTNDYDTPQDISVGSGRTAKTVRIGLFNICAILDDNSLKCWGDNQYGQVGIGNTTSPQSAPQTVGL